MKVSLFRVKEKSKKIISCEDFGFDVFVNDSNLFAIFCVLKSDAKVNSDKTITILAKITASKENGASKIEYIDKGSLGLVKRKRVMDVINGYVRDNYLKK